MSSPRAPDGSATFSSRRLNGLWKRGKLRNGTFILPGTGERIRRQITFRSPADCDGPSEQSPSTPNAYSQARTFRTAVDSSVTLVKDSAKGFWAFLKTPTAKGIFKCSLAYLLGSMATFLPPIAKFLGHQDGKHLVATITVYFHPARSAGSMEEAAILGICAFCYAVFISVSSMAVAVFCETQLGLIELGYALILIVFCGGGLGFVGWFKQKYNAPLVSVACSLASLAIITVLTKENAVQVGVFSDDKIVQVMKMVLMGIFATSIVSLLVWPISARAELRETMIKTTDSFGDMLTMITRGFLSGSEADLQSPSFKKASSRYKSIFPQLTKNLKEAKFEHYVLGTENQYRIEANLVNCMQKLAQSIGGLRSAATTQFTLLKEGAGAGTPAAGFKSTPGFHGVTPSSSVFLDRERFATLTAIEEASEEGSGAEDQQGSVARPILERHDTDNSVNATTPEYSSLPTAKTTGEIFSRFITHLGPSMKSLAYTVSEILNELPFGPGPTYSIAINERFQTSLADALELYSNARAEALTELYMSKEMDRTRPESLEADFEEVAASCGQFSFSLYDFGTEMQTFLTVLQDLKQETENSKSRSWRWLRFWRIEKKVKASNEDPEQEPLLGHHKQLNPLKIKGDPDIAQLVLERRNTMQLKQMIRRERHTRQGLYLRTLHFFRFLERDDVRFALKVGIGASLYALFAFIPATRPFYQHWRGEWGLLSYMLVCSMTIGASNTTGWARFIGTFIGAAVAVVTWAICQGNPFALAFCGWLVSLPCFYIIYARGQGPFGRFIMLTYNLSCLYAYSLSIKEGQDDDDEGGTTPFIVEIALHRLVAVLAGVIWGLFITRLIWPISARQKFKDGLSLLWLRMGLIWKRDPLSVLLEGESDNSYMNLREEFALQGYVLRLAQLRTAAASEFELRGPFPSQHYSRIMESTSKMLDAFHSMNVVLQKDLHASEGEMELLAYTADERAQLSARISHLFQVLASSLKLEYPLNDALPRIAHTRDRLLAKIFQYRKTMANAEEEGEHPPIVKDEDFEMLYAYTLVTGQLAEEISKVEKEIEDLFGVMDEDLLKLQ